MRGASAQVQGNGEDVAKAEVPPHVWRHREDRMITRQQWRRTERMQEKPQTTRPLQGHCWRADSYLAVYPKTGGDGSGTATKFAPLGGRGSLLCWVEIR